MLFTDTSGGHPAPCEEANLSRSVGTGSPVDITDLLPIAIVKMFNGAGGPIEPRSVIVVMSL
jgi:hypothetical protein